MVREEGFRVLYHLDCPQAPSGCGVHNLGRKFNSLTCTRIDVVYRSSQNDLGLQDVAHKNIEAPQQTARVQISMAVRGKRSLGPREKFRSGWNTVNSLGSYHLGER